MRYKSYERLYHPKFIIDSSFNNGGKIKFVLHDCKDDKNQLFGFYAENATPSALSDFFGREKTGKKIL